MTNYHLVSCRNDIVSFVSSTGEQSETVPMGNLILSGRDCHIRSFRVPYKSRDDINNYLKREMRKIHPGPYEEIDFDYIRLKNKMVLAVFIHKQQLRAIRLKIGKRRQIFLPAPTDHSHLFKHSDGVNEVYGDIVATPGCVKFDITQKKSVSTFKMKSIFNRSRYFYQKGFAISLLSILCLFFLVLPWLYLNRTYTYVEELKQRNQSHVIAVDKSNQLDADYKEKHDQLLNLYYSLKPDITFFLEDLNQSGLPTFGIDRIYWDNGSFRMFIWTKDPSDYIKILSENPQISDLVSSGSEENGISGISISGRYHE
jgi:hypothetical protein